MMYDQDLLRWIGCIKPETGEPLKYRKSVGNLSAAWNPTKSFKRQFAPYANYEYRNDPTKARGAISNWIVAPPKMLWNWSKQNTTKTKRTEQREVVSNVLDSCLRSFVAHSCGSVSFQGLTFPKQPQLAGGVLRNHNQSGQPPKGQPIQAGIDIVDRKWPYRLMKGL